MKSHINQGKTKKNNNAHLPRQIKHLLVPPFNFKIAFT